MDPRVLRLGLALLVAVLVVGGWPGLPENVAVHWAGLGAPVWVLFLIGLTVRASQWFRSRGPEGPRERAVRLRRERIAVRRLAEGVPTVQGDGADAEDEDPTLPWNAGP